MFTFIVTLKVIQQSFLDLVDLFFYVTSCVPPDIKKVVTIIYTISAIY